MLALLKIDPITLQKPYLYLLTQSENVKHSLRQVMLTFQDALMADQAKLKCGKNPLELQIF